MRNLGVEFGATTGRPRRCGWLDMVALKYAIMLNGVTRLIMTKADVLDSFDTIRVAVAYLVNGKQTTRLPYDINVPVEPVYKEFKGWNSDITGITNEQDLPVELAEYIRFIEHETGVPIHIVSVGPNRDSTIVRA